MDTKCFITLALGAATLFHPNLIFVTMTRAYQSGAPRAIALTANIGHRQNYLLTTEMLAFDSKT